MKEITQDILIMAFDFFIGGLVFFTVLNVNLRGVTGSYLEISDFIVNNFYYIFALLIVGITLNEGLLET